MKVKLHYILLIFATICACEKLDTNIPDTNTAEQGDTATVNAATYCVDDILNGEIAEAFTENSDTSFSKVWLSGYIVGYASGTKLTSATFAAGDKQTNILLADSPLETDYRNCIPVQLNTSSAANKQVREALNLSTHPDNLKKKVGIYGDLTYYMSAVGMKNITKYNFLKDDFDYNNSQTQPQEDINNDDENNENNPPNNNGDENNQNENDDNNESNQGNQENKDKNEDTPKDPLGIDTYTVSYMRHELTDYFNENDIKNITNCPVQGYIVGYVRKNKSTISQTSFELVLPPETNIVLADTPNEKDPDNCIAVQLSTGSTYIEARKALNLKDNPQNLGKLVIVLGTIEKYMGALGVKNTRAYSFPESP
ncbi:MAG: hypothetical protein IJT97_08595 [Bacteroidaceae bacterium]|nr:hypothetical protein [Bacteroidaceae bacterium]